MSTIVRAGIVAALLAALGQAANAEDILFNFQGATPNPGTNIGQNVPFAGSSLYAPPPVLTASATATGTIPIIGTTTSNPFVNQSTNGLGVGHTLDLANGRFDLDNTGFLETLNLTLSNLGAYQDFQLIAVLVQNADSNDDLQVLKNGTLNQSISAGSLVNGANVLTTPISLLLGNTIGLKGTGTGFNLGGNDDYQIAGVIIRAFVPEPASLAVWGLIGGVGFVGSRLRRRFVAAV